MIYFWIIIGILCYCVSQILFNRLLFVLEFELYRNQKSSEINSKKLFWIKYTSFYAHRHAINTREVLSRFVKIVKKIFVPSIHKIQKYLLEYKCLMMFVQWKKLQRFLKSISRKWLIFSNTNVYKKENSSNIVGQSSNSTSSLLFDIEFYPLKLWSF